MSDPQRPCQLVQEEMAWGRGLNEEDQRHVRSCRRCSETAAQFDKLDSLVCSVMGADIPDGFVDRVIGQLEAEKPGKESSTALGLTVLERLFLSKAVQWALVGIGSVFGLIKILRFFAVVLANASI